MKIDQRAIKIQLFIWYTWMLVHLKKAWECIVYWAGLYLPLFIVNMVVREFEKRNLDVENDDLEKFQLEFFRIEYRVPYISSDVPTSLKYDITARMLWFLHYVGDNYEDMKDYIPRVIPWGDIHSHNFKNEDAKVVFNYHIAAFDGKKYYKPVCTTRMCVRFNNQYNWCNYIELPHLKKQNLPPPSYEIMFNTLNFLEPKNDSDEEAEEEFMY